MKLKHFAIIAALAAGVTVASCNSDDDNSSTVTDTSGGYSVVVNSFSLAKNDSVIANLDSVFFSIDLDNARIFNADSLPYGTKLPKAVMNIGLPTVREAKLIIQPAAGETRCDTVDYLTSSTDSIDLTRGPVTLRVVSANGEVTRDYEIKVNIHQTDAAQLVWRETTEGGKVPTSLSAVTAAGVAEAGDDIVCLTTDGTSYSRAVSTDPYSGNWTTSSVTLPAGAQVQSLQAVETTLYIVTSDSHLYSSSDLGQSWSDTGASMTHLYGPNGNLLLGALDNGDGTYSHVTYPATVTTAVPASCPVAGTSQAIQYTTQWAPAPMTMVVGGVTASGELTGATWAYDGEKWAAVSVNNLPAMTGVSLIPYFTSRVNNQWVWTTRSTLVALGGLAADGTVSRQPWVSYDQGVNWVKGPETMALPESVKSFYGAPALVRNHTIDASRAVRPITEWDCPYIYIFGGYDEQGTFNDEMWRGVINRLTFKPIQ